MAKITISDITSGFASVTALNTNFQSVEDELNNKVLYRNNPSGESNQMENDLDMNNNDILNVNSIQTNELTINGTDITSLVTASDDAAASALEAAASAVLADISASEAAISAAVVADWDFKNSWITTTVYLKNNIVTFDGETYICLVDHTSGTFSTDYAALKWAKLASKGAAGAGTGDLLSTNNLSDVSNTSTALANLGGQPVDATLIALAGWANGTNKIPYTTSTDTVASLSFLDEDDMASDSATGVPSQQSVNARINNVISSASAATPVASEDYFLFEDATDNTQKKALISAISSSPFTGKYESTATTITLGGLHTFAHSLGAVPFGVVIMLENVTADGGYSTGDRIYIDTGFQNQSGGGGQAVYADSTNVYVRISTAVYQSHRKDTGAPFNLTTASWKIVVKAFV